MEVTYAVFDCFSLGVGKSSHHFFTLSVDVHSPGLEDGGVDM